MKLELSRYYSESSEKYFLQLRKIDDKGNTVLSTIYHDDEREEALAHMERMKVGAKPVEILKTIEL